MKDKNIIQNLPCNIGETVWVIFDDNSIHSGKFIGRSNDDYVVSVNDQDDRCVYSPVMYEQYYTFKIIYSYDEIRDICLNSNDVSTELDDIKSHLEKAKEEYVSSFELTRNVIKKLSKLLKKDLICYSSNKIEDQKESYYSENLYNTIWKFIRGQTPSEYNINRLISDIKNAITQDEKS